MTTLAARALLARKIRLGRIVIAFYLITFTIVGITTYLASR